MGAQPPVNTTALRGAVDLSGLAAKPAEGAAAAPASSGGVVVAVTDTTFTAEVMERSKTVPVVVDFWATWCGPCKQLSPVLEKLASEYEGKFVLATIDTDANPQLSQLFGIQSIPTVFAVIKGQPVPLFQGAQPAAQVKAVIDQVLQVAAANGVTGQVEVGDSEAAATESEADEPQLPPHHQAAYDAIEAGDVDGAIAAYQQALQENPHDEMAKAGLAHTRLMKRTADVDARVARQVAAANPDDVAAQLTVADLDVLGGHVDDAFGRLLTLIRTTSGGERNRIRDRLLELFDVVGADDIRVPEARTALANALF